MKLRICFKTLVDGRDHAAVVFQESHAARLPGNTGVAAIARLLDKSDSCAALLQESHQSNGMHAETGDRSINSRADMFQVHLQVEVALPQKPAFRSLLLAHRHHRS